MPTSTPNILNPAAPTPSDNRTVSTRFGMIMELPEVDGDVCAPKSLLEPPVINGSRNFYKMSSNYFSSIAPANHGNGTVSSSLSQVSSSLRKLATVSDTLPLGASSFLAHQEPHPVTAHPPPTERHYQQLNHNPISPHRRVEEAFQEMVDEQPRERERPLIVLDCANIGWHYADHSKFSAQGVYLAITGLRSLHDSDIVAFLPAAYLHRARRIQNQDGAYVEMDTDDWDQLHDLLRHNLLAIVPSGDSDDAYILEYARSHQGFVVSNDLFRDHIGGLEVTSMQLSMQLWLQENRCGYCFVGNEFYLNPQSSLSRILQQPRTRGIMLPSFDALLGQLSQCCETLYSWQRPLEMQYLLLARSRLFYEMGCIEEAKQSLQLIMRHVPSPSAEALQLLQIVNVFVPQPSNNSITHPSVHEHVTASAKYHTNFNPPSEESMQRYSQRYPQVSDHQGHVEDTRMTS